MALGIVGCGGGAETTAAGGGDGAGGDGAGGSGAGDTTTSSGTAGGDPACPQAADFLDVSKGSAGPSYPAPTLSASCEGDEVIVKSNGIPNFEFDQVTPNALTAQNFNWHFPKTPQNAASSSDVPLGGPSAVAVNGLPIFGPTEAPQMGYHDPLLDDLLDYCSGHTAPGGVYHFHARPDCLFDMPDGNPALVVGYAFDGYPILAPYMCEDAACTSVKKVSSGYQPVDGQFDANGNPLYIGTTKGAWDIFEYVAGSGDLDECNGADLPGGGYAYFATDTFPYFMGCYRGTPTPNALGPGM